MQRKPFEARKSIWASQLSEFSGQPWLNTTGWPTPQSLNQIWVPSRTVIVLDVRIAGEEVGVSVPMLAVIDARSANAKGRDFVALLPLRRGAQS